MLVLSRKNREAIVIGGSGGLARLLKVTVVEISGGKVKLGFEADGDIPIHRFEVWQRICAEGQASHPMGVPPARVVLRGDETVSADPLARR